MRFSWIFAGKVSDFINLNILWLLYHRNFYVQDRKKSEFPFYLNIIIRNYVPFDFLESFGSWSILKIFNLNEFFRNWFSSIVVFIFQSQNFNSWTDRQIVFDLLLLILQKKNRFDKVSSVYKKQIQNVSVITQFTFSENHLDGFFYLYGYCQQVTLKILLKNSVAQHFISR